MTRSVLKRVLDPGGLSPRFQPIVRVGPSFGAPKLFGFECLTRGPEDTLFHSADLLFDYVRRKRAEPEVDRECIKNALRCCRTVSRDSMVSVNVHASTILRDPGFSSFLQELLAENGIAEHNLVVEIVEHGVAEDEACLRACVAQLRTSGVHIALDDVGSGFSNYRMIVDLRPEFLKADAYLVKTCSTDPNRRSVLRSLVALASDLNSRIVAEGIETVDDLEVVLGLGITLIQGYYFSPPVTIEGLRLFTERLKFMRPFIPAPSPNDMASRV